MPVTKATITGPFHGIITDLPPTTDSQGFEDVVNWMGWKARLRTRPGLNMGAGFTAPDSSPIMNMTSFEDVENYFHTVALTLQNPYMLTAGPTFNLLTYPSFIKSVTLDSPGVNYSVGDVLNLEQVGATGGSVVVQTVATGGITAVQGVQLGGTGYQVGDVLTIIQGTSSTAQVTVTSIGAGGVVTGVTLTNSGSGYSTALNVPTQGGHGTGAYISIAVGGLIQSAVVTSPGEGGTGYVVGDVLGVIQGSLTGSNATLTVAAVTGSGVITSLAVTNPGRGYVAGAANLTGGTGSGAVATLAVTSTSLGVITSIGLNDPGNGYSSATGLLTNGGTGSGATVSITTSLLITLGGTTGTGLPYAVVKANNRVYFSNGSAPLCYIDGEAGFKLAGNVPGACKFLTANAGHLIGANWTEPDPTQPSSINYPNRVRWSDSSNFDQWDTSAPQYDSGQADVQDTPDNISGLSTLGTNSYIYRTNGISIMTPTGSSTEPFYIRNFSLAPKGEGNAYPYSLTTHNNIDRFIGNYDVWAFDGSSFAPLMDKKCNAKFYNDLNSATGLYQVRGMITTVLDNGFTFLAYVITIPGANVSWVLNIAESSWSRFEWLPPTGATQGFYDLQFIEQVYLT